MTDSEFTRGENQHRISKTHLSSFPHFIEALLSVKSAAARANKVAGELTQIQVTAIAEACAQLNSKPSLFTVDPFSGGGGILINSQVNRLLAAESKVELGAINLSQSTADVVATALRIALIHVGSKLETELKEATRLLELNQTKFAQTPSTARTCLQDAMKVPLGTLFEGYTHAITRRAQAVTSALAELRQINLGGTVIGSGEGASVVYKDTILSELKKETGLDLRLRASLFDAAQNADDIGRLAHELALLSEVSIKIAKDLRLLHSGPKQGLGELRLPQVIQGSSFFKAKNNPTIPETVLQGCFLALGRCRTAGLTLEHAELNLNVFETAGGFALYEALEILANSFQILNDSCLEAISSAKDTE